VDDTDTVYKSFQRIRGNKALYTFEDIIGENRELVAAKTLAKKSPKPQNPKTPSACMDNTGITYNRKKGIEYNVFGNTIFIFASILI